jgi:2-polyprenyl-3-methyl-5-hydroxy-6-metoxy-1,4-benzoquinol methylase
MSDTQIVLSLGDIDAGEAGLRSAERQDFQRGVFELPDWLDPTLDPHSEAYRDQQLRLWRQVSGRDSYREAADEMTPEVSGADAVRRPAFYGPGDSELAGEHLIALGHLLYRSDVRRGATALEYGAGFGQIAVALARLGVAVHTVDISESFCAAVTAAARHYDVEVTAHNAAFGYAPEGKSFDLVYFYEAFHHAFEFRQLIPRLHQLLAPGGRLILAGEPIVPDTSPIVPYPWGIRMDVENVVIIRERGWMELGFQQSYLLGLFVKAGFVWQHHECPPSRQAELWVLEKRPDVISLATHALTPAEAATWHGPEPTGRWTRDRAVLNVDESTASFDVVVVNFHPLTREVTLSCGNEVILEIGAGHQETVRMAQAGGELVIESEPLIPRDYGGAADDDRELGIFVESISYF